MAAPEELSFAYLEMHPVDAARVLERIAPQDVAALLANAPARITAEVLRVMLPLHAARCFGMMADDVTSGLLRAMGPQASVRVLHYLPETRRFALLESLPTALAVTFRLLLGYPEDTVGAWMDPRALALPADTPAEIALKRVRDTDGQADTAIFVIDQAQSLLGQAELARVLRAAPDTPLSKVMQQVAYALPARTMIRAVEGHAGWAERQVLPVVERENRFVGALDRGVLLRALSRERNVNPDDGYGDLIATVVGEYWLGVSSLIQLMVDLLPVARPLPNVERYERQR